MEADIHSAASQGDAQPGGVRVRAGSSELAIPLSELDAVIECPPLAPVPAAPSWLIGVGARKGRVMPVADLAALTGDGTVSAPAVAGERLLLVESGQHLLAFSVSRVLSHSLAEPSSDTPQVALRALAARLLERRATESVTPGA